MYLRYYLVYAEGADHLVAASPLPEQTAYQLSARGYARFWVGDVPFPHWLAADVAKQAQQALAESAGRGDRRTLQEVVGRRLRRWGRYTVFAWERISPMPPVPRPGADELLAVLRGRIVFAVEAARMLRGTGRIGACEEALAELAVSGLVAAFPSVEILHFGRAVCRRCGETQLEEEDCWYCGDRRCWVCPTCRRFGVSSGCRTLYARAQPRTAESIPFPEPTLDFVLTPAQRRAAQTLGEFIRRCEAEEFLVWAVCGAGKTEVVLDALAGVRAMGRMLIASPRRDVAAELAKRVAAAFPGLPLSVHYGGRHEDEAQACAMTIATTHQCLRFYEAFDLVILDEVDAFPFQGSRMLYQAVQRARRCGGQLVYLTATPPSHLVRRAKEGTLPYVRLPVRHHGHPLPVPELIRTPLGLPGPGWRPPAVLAGMFATSHRPWLVFVPTVDLAVRTGQALDRWGRSLGLRVASIHAADTGRDEKRKAFVDGRLDLVVTTTVLERGLTLGAIDVCVLFADNTNVFNTSCLIQVAGRAGRLADCPHGRVVFVAERLSAEMRTARADIMEANAEALREGFYVPSAQTDRFLS